MIDAASLHLFTARSNPLGGAVPHAQWQRFARRMPDAGVQLTVTECAYGKEDFHLAGDGARHIGNVVGRYDPRPNVYPHKNRTEQKIDAAVAGIMAIGPAMASMPPRSRYENPNEKMLFVLPRKKLRGVARGG